MSRRDKILVAHHHDTSDQDRRDFLSAACQHAHCVLCGSLLYACLGTASCLRYTVMHNGHIRCKAKLRVAKSSKNRVESLSEVWLPMSAVSKVPVAFGLCIAPRSIAIPPALVFCSSVAHVL